MPLTFALPRGSAIILLGWRALRGVGYEPEAVAVRLVWFRARDFLYPPIAQIFTNGERLRRRILFSVLFVFIR